MFKNIFAILAVSVIASIAVPVNAQIEIHIEAESIQRKNYYLTDFFRQNPPDCRIYYPEPIGGIPSHVLNDICSPPPIAIIPRYGKEYARLMRSAINAGARGDYNSALINFRRAHNIEISKEFLGYRNREALRGINGAIVAKRYQKQPHPSKRLTPQFFWHYWTGTGDRGNWGKVLPPDGLEAGRN